MTCQHCQTWILDEEHRCPRCGRRLRRTPERLISGGGANGYSATATARAYEWQAESTAQAASEPRAEAAQPETIAEAQAHLFAPNPAGYSFPYSDPAGRVIPFDSLTTQVARQAIRARAAGLERPEPVKTEKVQVKRARHSARSQQQQQRALVFDGQREAVEMPQSSIICDAPVAPTSLRLQAACIDIGLMAIPCLLGALLFWYAAGEIPTGKHLVLCYLVALGTVPVLYKLLWTIAGTDTPGMRAAGIFLVDFDGNPPSQSRRYQRCVSSMLSVLAAGVGLVWSLVDEDGLTWHDHISSTFPTVE